MSLYCTAINWGEGFITHGDKEKGNISGYPGDVWVVGDNMRQWMAKVNATTKTKSEAQTIVTTIVDAAKTRWDNDNVEGESASEKVERVGPKPTDITLP